MTVQTDRTLVREGGKSVRHALLSFFAPDVSRSASRPALNVAFVLDRSGSMGGSKIELARAAVIQAVRVLRSDDRFAVVSYDNEIEVVVPSTHATPEAVQNAVAQVQDIRARGNTNLGGGWLKGCEQMAAHQRDGETTRCLLLSDGLANEGITDRNELAEHSRALGARGVRTSCLGIGADYDEQLLAAIATASGGHSYHVETAIQIPDYLHSELGEALETVARDVVVTVRPTPGISMTTLNHYPLVTNADGTVSLQLGDLIARQDVSLVFRLEFPAGAPQSTASAVFAVTDPNGVLAEPDRDIVWTFAGHVENDRQPRNRTVDRIVAELYAAAARAEALELNRAGRFDDARERLEKTAKAIEQYAGSDPEMLRVIAELRERHDSYSAPMSAVLLKKEYSQSLSSSRMRDVTGKARRRPTS
jgi:Ca-activated chloride channel family protein